MLDVLDFTAPLPGIGFCAGRIGNFINSELWGAPTDWKFGFLVPDPVTGELVGRHASQLYEAGLEGLVLFAIVWWFARRPRPRGAVVGLALAWYGMVRFLIEFVRVPDAADRLPGRRLGDHGPGAVAADDPGRRLAAAARAHAGPAPPETSRAT